MDELDVKAEFRRLVEVRPPLPSTLDPGWLIDSGEQAARRRRAVWVGAGSVLTAAALTVGMLVLPASVVGRRAAPTSSVPAASPIRPPATASSTAAAATGLPRLADAEQCGDRFRAVDPVGFTPEAAPLPSVAAVQAAVAAAVPRLLPGAVVRYVHTWQTGVDIKSSLPKLAAWFDLTDSGGRGGFEVEIHPFRGATAQAMADNEFGSRLYLNCTAARRLTEQDGSAGLVYVKPLGEARYARNIRGRAIYLDHRGVRVRVDTAPWPFSTLYTSTLAHPGEGVQNPLPTRQTLPMTPDQAYALAKLVGQLPLGR
jgi:hypothetical protein